MTLTGLLAWVLCIAGVGLIIGFFFGPLHWFWCALGIALVVIGWWMIRRDRERDHDRFDVDDVADLIDTGIDLLD
jgi:hypothetical protein